MKAILFSYLHHPERFDVRGYVEQGSTTTPFDMHVRNKTSRCHLVIAAYESLEKSGRVSHDDVEAIRAKYMGMIDENTAYIKENGIDLPELDAWVWPAARGVQVKEEEAWHGQTN